MIKVYTYISKFSREIELTLEEPKVELISKWFKYTAFILNLKSIKGKDYSIKSNTLENIAGFLAVLDQV